MYTKFIATGWACRDIVRPRCQLRKIDLVLLNFSAPYFPGPLHVVFIILLLRRHAKARDETASAYTAFLSQDQRRRSVVSRQLRRMGKGLRRESLVLLPRRRLAIPRAHAVLPLIGTLEVSVPPCDSLTVAPTLCYVG
jgi:hypothetical protein